ncbi:MAG: UDP-3-O-(3-hydroxymyristoyl)glucosamine N-acyltransferase [Gammaproteobacteria bacterium]|nr:UDP-3-O-(3-hydroxymyristoyl)glucosamine N-acyltransferase [Gammaproteobacteria bacterium]
MELTLGELAERTGAQLHGDPGVRVHAVAALGQAGPGTVAYLADARHRRLLAETRASAVILAPAQAADCPAAALVCANPHATYACVARLLHPTPQPEPGVHPTAVVSPEARLAPDAAVGPCAVIEAGAVLEAGVWVGPGCVVGAAAHLDAGTRLVARVTVAHGCRLGRRGLVHPGAVIGADGFGLARDGEVWIKVPQLGTVRIGDDVEIGANTTIDRGALEDTVIGDGVKLDNQVQVAHNVRIGAHTAVAGCVGIAGSVRIGRGCAIGGGVGIADHIRIADGVQVTGGSVVLQSITAPGVYSSGTPVESNGRWRRNFARFRQLDELWRRVRALEKSLTTKE